MTSLHIHIHDLDQFDILRDIPREDIGPEIMATVRGFSEEEDMEESILRILADPNRTPHGPTELADILTQQLTYRRQGGLGAFILKGRSFQTVRQRDVSHQIYRLRKIADLKFAGFGFVGNLLDDARDEFIGTATDLGIPYFLADATDFARLGIASGLICRRDGRRLQDGRCDCGYRYGGDDLNFLQRDVLTALNDSHALNQSRGLVVMPTGSGKTRVAALDASRSGARRILYLAHTHEIIEVAAREFEHVFGSEAIVRNFEETREEPIVDLATIQTARSRLSQIEETAYEYVVVDEFHHAAARSYRQLLDSINPDYVLGLTATPYRSDWQDVAELCYGNIVASFDLRVGIDQGILVPYRYHGCFDNVDYSILEHQGGQYRIEDLNRALIIPERDTGIIRKWRELADDQPTIAFCVGHQHAERIAAAFRNAGVPAETYLSSTGWEERQALRDAFQYGDIRILCTVDIFNEGVDLPYVGALLFLRPTLSKRIFFQQLGRGLRKSPGKVSVTVLDFIGNFANAYRIVEYLGLSPFEEDPPFHTTGRYTPKETFHLPLGCEVHFDDRVIDLFQQQVIDHSRPTRHNIAQILIYTYYRTCRRLGRLASRRDVDRQQLLHSELYDLVFGSWSGFLQQIDEESILTFLDNYSRN